MLNMRFIGDPVLVVIDIQKDGYVSTAESGIQRMTGFSDMVRRSREIVAAARRAGIPIVFTQEVHRASGIDIGRELDGTETMHCADDNPLTDLVDDLRPEGPNEFLVQKRRYSAFYLTELELLLRAVKATTLILIGGLTDVCVLLTAADAHQRDFHFHVVEDCVIGSSMDAHEASLGIMTYLQKEAVIGSQEAIDALRSLTTAAV
jgi:nicotinamidase-related amidase